MIGGMVKTYIRTQNRPSLETRCLPGTRVCFCSVERGGLFEYIYWDWSRNQAFGPGGRLLIRGRGAESMVLYCIFTGAGVIFAYFGKKRS
jgi:hypothetical protein